MIPDRLVRPRSLAAAEAVLLREGEGAVLRAGGVDLMDRWKSGIDRHGAVVDLRAVEAAADRDALWGLAAARGTLRVGAMVPLATVAATPLPEAFDAVVQAAASAANPAIRRLATVGGNLLQRPRCWYFRHPDLQCLKKGGGRCFAVGGRNRYHAVFDGGPSHIVHPSTLATALSVFDAQVVVRRVGGAVDPIPVEDFFVPPSRRLDAENVLRHGEIVLGAAATAPEGVRSGYAKIGDRRLYDWPLVEAAVALGIRGGEIRNARVALGQVAPVPRRAEAARRHLIGKRPSAAVFAEAAERAFEGAVPLSDNAGKIAVGKGLLRKLLHRVAGVPLPP